MNLAASLFRASASRSRGRLMLLTGAVALGVLILFLFSAYHHALFDKSYTAWQQGHDDARLARALDEHTAMPAGEGDPLWMQRYVSSDILRLGDRSVTAWLVSTDGGAPELPATLERWPQPGEYWVSPAVEEFMKAHSHYDTGVRFGQSKLGVLPESMVAGPDELVVIMGLDKDQIPDPVPVRTFNAPVSQMQDNIIGAVIYLGVVIVLFPVLVLISIAAKLGSVQREQRYAALRLVGATNRQILQIITFESLVAAIGGFALGALAYLATRPLLFNLNFGAGRQWASRIDLTPVHWVVVALATAGIIFFSNAWGMRKLRLSPLGVARVQHTERRPGVSRLLPLMAGVGVFVYVYTSVEENKGNVDTVFEILAGVVLTMIGLVLAGPWFAYALGALTRRVSNSAGIFIGSSYIRAHASRVSRSVVGVVLALFAGSFFLTAVSDIPDDFFDQGSDAFTPGTVRVVGATQHDIVAFHEAPWVAKVHVYPELAGAYIVLPCADAPRYFKDVACNDGVVAFNPYAQRSEAKIYGENTAVIAQKLEDVGAYIAYDDVNEPVTANIALIQLREPGDIEALRNTLAAHATTGDLRIDSGHGGSGQRTTIYMLTQLTYVGIAVTFVVSVISLVVSTYAGLLERRRSLLSLRLSGMKISQLGKMVLVESFVPLVAMATVATAAGIGAGFVLMRVVSHSLNARLTWLYLAVLIGALIAAGFAIATILPSMKKMTELSVNRTE
ncbi:ABC transporter permease [Trueperella pecoris]|uniref:ABC transporter permease n=1 Tax=Trueperella pecoris TaxID=2733571 RepID=UPI001ABE9684|nr:ABC transporter permease [Trueperella pecoris]QTG74977.1 ABC transporter permease [Trueperella pecoris]